RFAFAAPDFTVKEAAPWDDEELLASIIATQKSCCTSHAAMEARASEPWDYNPPSDASPLDVRNHIECSVAANRYRDPARKNKVL
ncbi:MAG: choline-sulfatase, partial [Pseudomonadota bacterium]